MILQLVILNFEYPQVLNLRVSINWTPTNGIFDLKHYRVQLCSGPEVCTDIVNTTRSSAEMVLETNFLELNISAAGGTVYALVSTESLCDDVGNSSRSNNVGLATATATATVPVPVNASCKLECLVIIIILVYTLLSQIKII